MRMQTGAHFFGRITNNVQLSHKSPFPGNPTALERSACLSTGTSVRISSHTWVEDTWAEGEYWFPEALFGGGTTVGRANSNRLWAREKCRTKANISDKLVVSQTKGSVVKGPHLLVCLTHCAQLVRAQPVPVRDVVAQLQRFDEPTPSVFPGRRTGAGSEQAFGR